MNKNWPRCQRFTANSLKTRWYLSRMPMRPHPHRTALPHHHRKSPRKTSSSCNARVAQSFSQPAKSSRLRSTASSNFIISKMATRWLRILERRLIIIRCNCQNTTRSSAVKVAVTVANSSLNKSWVSTSKDLSKLRWTMISTVWSKFSSHYASTLFKSRPNLGRT